GGSGGSLRVTRYVRRITHHASRTTHPSATSSTIIKVNPSMVPTVARSVWPPRCDSGISSSTTTYIIAPAAKASAYGRIGATSSTAATPITAATGSTAADICPQKKDLRRETPS